MQTFLAFRAAAVPQEQLGHILTDYLALDRARIVRRLMMMRFGVLAVAAVLLETVVHGFSAGARSFTLGLSLLPVACAWIVELAREWRLLRYRNALGKPATR